MADLPFIDAEADRFDNILLAHLKKRLVGTVHGLLEIDLLLLHAVGEDIAVVDESDVDSFDRHALEAVFQRSHGSVIGIVELEREGSRINPWCKVDGAAICWLQQAPYLG